MRPAETLAPVAESLKKSQTHPAFSARRRLDKSPAFNTAAYFKAKLEDGVAEAADAWGAEAGLLSLEGCR